MNINAIHKLWICRRKIGLTNKSKSQGGIGTIATIFMFLLLRSEIYQTKDINLKEIFQKRVYD
jgi:hypothetical protein